MLYNAYKVVIVIILSTVKLTYRDTENMALNFERQVELKCSMLLKFKSSLKYLS